MNTVAESPFGCRHCGVAAGDHGRRWHREAGLHRFEEPPKALIFERMLARRAARTTTKTTTRGNR